jgi:hypothetical protein
MRIARLQRSRDMPGFPRSGHIYEGSCRGGRMLMAAMKAAQNAFQVG